MRRSTSGARCWTRTSKTSRCVAAIATSPSELLSWSWLLLIFALRSQVINNLAVTLLYQARLNEALALLTTALADQPRLAYHSEPILFNLATLQELRTEQATGAKVRVLRELARSQGAGGQGIRSGCLKLAL